MLCFFSDGKLDCEGCLPVFTFGQDRPIVKCDDLFGDGQSQPGAPGVGGAGVIQTIELFKQSIQFICGDRFASAGDPNEDSLFPRFGADDYLCPRVTVSRRVFQKVVEDPGQLLPVPPDLERLLGAEGHIVPMLREQGDIVLLLRYVVLLQRRRAAWQRNGPTEKETSASGKTAGGGAVHR